MSNRDRLKEIGEALYGSKHWQAGLTRLLELNSSRRVRHWLSGTARVPDGVWDDLLKALKARRTKLDKIIKNF